MIRDIGMAAARSKRHGGSQGEGAAEAVGLARAESAEDDASASAAESEGATSAKGEHAAPPANPLATLSAALSAAVSAPPADAPVVKVGQLTRQMLHATREKMWERIAAINNQAHGQQVVSLWTEPVPYDR